MFFLNQDFLHQSGTKTIHKFLCSILKASQFLTIRNFVSKPSFKSIWFPPFKVKLHTFKIAPRYKANPRTFNHTQALISKGQL